MRFLSTVALCSWLLLAAVPDGAARIGGGDSERAVLTVGPDVLQAGNAVRLQYSSPSRAGQTVVVTIDDGVRRSGRVATIEIKLDANGNGAASWTVPAWEAANFNAPGAVEVNCPVVGSA